MAVSTAPNSELARSYIGGLAHVHTRLSNYHGHHDSSQTIGELVNALVAKGLAGSASAPFEFVVVTEHSSDPTRPRKLGRYGLRARALTRQRWLTTLCGVPIFHGFEANLLPGGQIDLTPRLAKDSELVIASRHWMPPGTDDSARAIAHLFERACTDPDVDVIGHPARGIEDLSDLDWRQVFGMAERTATAIEVNLNNFPDPKREPRRLEVWSRWMQVLGHSGAPVFIGIDLHNDLMLERFYQGWSQLDHEGADGVLGGCLGLLVASGISPERVVTSRLDRLRNWLSSKETATPQRSRV